VYLLFKKRLLKAELTIC
jgi:cytochrome P450